MQLLRRRLHAVVEVGYVADEVEAEMTMDTTRSQLLLHLLVCKAGLLHFEDQVLVPLARLRLAVIALVRLVKDNEHCKDGRKSYLHQH